MPPNSGKVDVWKLAVSHNPMPIKYSLAPIADVLETEVVGLVPKLSEKKTNLLKALDEYCEALKEAGELDSCDPPGPDPDPPVLTNACRFCQDQCGGEYQVDGGASDMSDTWYNWYLTYTKGCPDHSYGTYGHLKVRLCCQSEIEDVSVGNCRYCNSCGGDYDLISGAFMADGTNKPSRVNAYGESCAGDPAPRYKTKDAFYFCCKKQQICAFCTSCGGTWSNEVGAMSRTAVWPQYFKEYDEGCQGSIDHHTYRGNDGVKLCCIGGNSTSTPAKHFL